MKQYLFFLPLMIMVCSFIDLHKSHTSKHKCSTITSTTNRIGNEGRGFRWSTGDNTSLNTYSGWKNWIDVSIPLNSRTLNLAVYSHCKEIGTISAYNSSLGYYTSDRSLILHLLRVKSRIDMI